MPQAGAAARPVRRLPWQTDSLVPLTRVHAAALAGDALVTVSLAGTLFFSVPIGQARGRVALYLLLTMAPFAVVAPVIGPLLDRTRSGRRTAIALTFVARAVLAWLMAGGGGGLRLYPAAFGVLVMSKGYGVAKAAAVPRLTSDETTLVGSNARLSAAGIACSTGAAAIGAGVVALAGYPWSLRLGAVVYLLGLVFATRLPAAVNSDPALPRERATSLTLGGPFSARVRTALTATLALRALLGFLTFFLAFSLRRAESSDLRFAAVVGAAALGSALGTALGAGLRRRPPESLLGGALVGAIIVCGLAALDYGFGAALALALVTGLGGALGKLAFDAILQREVADDVVGQAFARSETTLQLAWVAGGALGLIDVRESYGLAAAAIGLAVAAVIAARGLRGAPLP